MDIRQSKMWGDYLSQIGWTIENIDGTQMLIRKVPLFNFSLIKIQHPQNPLNFRLIDQTAKKHKSLFTLIEPEAKKFQEDTFIRNGYRPSTLSLTHTATLKIDLTKPEKEIFSNFSENARRNIKKAQQNKLITETVHLTDKNKDGEFNKFFELLKSLSKIKKFYIPSYGEFYKKMLAFRKNSLFLFAYDKSIPVAALWLGFNKDTIFYMHTGINQTGYNLLGNYLLVWEAVKQAKKMGLEVFDFEGIYDPRFPKERKRWIHFSEFKKRFHGTLVEYPAPMIKIYNPFFKLFYLCCKNLF